MGLVIYGILLIAAMLTGAAILGALVDWARNAWNAFLDRRAEARREAFLAKSHLDLIEEFSLDKMTYEGLAFWMEGVQLPKDKRRDIVRHLQAKAEYYRKQYEMLN